MLTEACFNKRTDARPQDRANRCEFIVGSYYLFESLLGLAGLQSHATLAEMESFQRAQAILLLQDRIAEGLQWFDRIDADELPTSLQLDYLRSYVAFYASGAYAAAWFASLG